MSILTPNPPEQCPFCAETASVRFAWERNGLRYVAGLALWLFMMFALEGGEPELKWWWVCTKCGGRFFRVSADTDRRVRMRPHECGQCGYNLTGNTSGTCPECGWRVPGARS